MVQTAIKPPFILPFTTTEVETSTCLRSTITRDEGSIQANTIHLCTEVILSSDHRITLDLIAAHEEQVIPVTEISTETVEISNIG